MVELTRVRGVENAHIAAVRALDRKQVEDSTRVTVRSDDAKVHVKWARCANSVVATGGQEREWDVRTS